MRRLEDFVFGAASGNETRRRASRACRRGVLRHLAWHYWEWM